jgi:hypothetical protein
MFGYRPPGWGRCNWVAKIEKICGKKSRIQIEIIRVWGEIGEEEDRGGEV